MRDTSTRRISKKSLTARIQEVEEEAGFLRSRMSSLEAALKEHIDASDHEFPDVAVHPRNTKSLGRPPKVPDVELKDRLRAMLRLVRLGIAPT